MVGSPYATQEPRFCSAPSLVVARAKAGKEAPMARGVHGQNICIDPRAELVIARFGSRPIAANPFTDPMLLPAYAPLARALME